MGKQTATAVELHVTNLHDFISLHHFVAEWRYLEDGATVRQGTLDIPPCRPHDTVTVWATHTPEDLPLPSQPPGVEIVLTVNLKPREALDASSHLHAVRSGRRVYVEHIVATEQFLLGNREPGGLGLPPAMPEPAELEVSTDDASVIDISSRRVGANFSMQFSKVTGLPVQMTTEGIRRLQVSLCLPWAV